MKSLLRHHGFIWGGLFVALGILLLLHALAGVSAWAWVAALALGGLAMGAFWIVASHNQPWKSSWLPLLPAYFLCALAAMIGLIASRVLYSSLIGAYVLAASALPFLVLFGRDRRQWWALVPSYLLLAVGACLLLNGLGMMDEPLTTTAALYSAALLFFVVFAYDLKQWWALIPGGALTLTGLLLVSADVHLMYVGAGLLILAGVGILVRLVSRVQNGRAAPGAEDPPDTTP